MHLLGLINDILDLAKAEAGKLACESVPFDLPANLSSIIDLVDSGAKLKGLTIRLEYPPTVRSMVAGDAGRIRQIVLNFVSNAIKFTDRGSVILSVEAPAHTRSDLLRIAVADTGQGLLPELEPHLFQRFVQGDSSNNRNCGGTGLGLAISKWLAEAMGGAVGLRNRPGGGAEFWVDLPLPQASTGIATVPVAATPLSYSKGRRVLIAEDNSVNQRVLVRLLEKRDVHADVTANGMEAIQMWRDFPYDLILMDCRIPEMDGYEATRRIRAQEQGLSHVPIIAATAHVGEGERQRCLASGMDGYLQKPIQPADLDQILLRHLGECSEGLTRAESRSPSPLKIKPSQVPGYVQHFADKE
jgi:CheY-like chemotaxis protein